MARAQFFYFRQVATIGDDDSATDSIMVPVSHIAGFNQKTDVTLDIYFKDFASQAGGLPMRSNNWVRIGVKSGKRNEIMELLAAATNGPVHSDGITIVADDITSTYLSTDITSCDLIVAPEPLTNAVT